MYVDRLPDGSGWGVYDSASNKLIRSFVGDDRSEQDAHNWMNDQSSDDDGGDSDGEGEQQKPEHGFDWEGKFNLDLTALMEEYGVDSDLQKYFSGMEYDPQQEGFLKDLFNVDKEQRQAKRDTIGRQTGNLESGYGMQLDTILDSGAAQSFKTMTDATQRQQSIGGGRGKSFGDRYNAVAAESAISGKQNVMMAQTTEKLASMDDALAALDFEAQQAQTGFEQDIYGERQQWMDDFFDRLMQVEQMENA